MKKPMYVERTQAQYLDFYISKLKQKRKITVTLRQFFDLSED